MTPTQRKNLIACYFCQKGLPHNIIIGLLCNAVTESAHTFSPTIGEFGGGGGFGIWQFTSQNTYVESHVAGKSEEDAIKWECDYLISYAAQWTGPVPWNQWLHSNISWQEATSEFTIYWERPANKYGQAEARKGNYNEVMNGLNWCAGGDAGGTGDGDNPQRKLTVADCQELLRKVRADQNSGGGGSVGGDGSFNMAPVWDYFNKYKGSLRYSMGLRNQVVNGTYSDCSAFVTYMVELALGLSDRSHPSTEGEHAWLMRYGYHKIYDSTSTKASDVPPTRAGDVCILGTLGTSAGGDGHTMLFVGNHQIIDCEGPTGSLGLHGPHSIESYFPYICPPYDFVNNWHVYVYRHGN